MTHSTRHKQNVCLLATIVYLTSFDFLFILFHTYFYDIETLCFKQGGYQMSPSVDRKIIVLMSIRY